MTKNLCFLDLEATGFDKKNDSIIEIALITRDAKKNEVSRFESVFKPDKTPLNNFIAQLTGISQAEIDQTGKNLGDYTSQLKDMIGDAVIIGHNIDFDIEFLTANGVDLSQNTRIDTHELARILLVNEESYALEVLALKYGFEQNSAHRAMSDVEVNIEIYDWLVQKINALPIDFLAQVQSLLQTKSTWDAKKLFLETDNNHEKTATETPTPNIPTPVAIPAEKISLGQHSFIRSGNQEQTTLWQKKIAQTEKKSVIITSKLDCFSEFTIIPTPAVLFSFPRFRAWIEAQTELDNEQTVFYLQCAWRHHLGYRGQSHFNLFFRQRDLWKNVCMQTNTAEEKALFQKILAEKNAEKTIIMTPKAYFELAEEALLKDRTLIIDEVEKFAESLLYHPTKEYSIRPYLNHEKTTVSAQFWVRNVCRDLLEPLLQKSLPPFPSKVLLPNQTSYHDLAIAWSEFCSTNDQAAADQLSNPSEGVVRWINYYPSTGNIDVNIWRSHLWKIQRDALASKKIVAFTHNPKSAGFIDFIKYFLGINQPTWLEIQSLRSNYKINIPNDLISVKSPDFNQFVTETIKKTIQSMPETERLVVNFSSQESLQKTYTELKQDAEINQSKYAILGERASGGSGKVVYLAQQTNNRILCQQQLAAQSISRLPYKQFILQKFPFSPPHPLLNRIEELVSAKGKNFWNIWVMVQVGANLAQRINVFSQLQTVTILDSRHNAQWGKELLNNVFGK